MTATKVLGTVGDVDYLTYDGGPVIERDDGTALVEWIVAPEEPDSIHAVWTVYGVDLDPEIPDWGEIEDVAATSGQNWMELAQAFKSDNPMERAWAYETWAGHYGWHELDNYPIELRRSEVEKRYGEQLYPLMPVVRERVDYQEGSQPGQILIDGFTLQTAYRSGHMRIYELLDSVSKRPLEVYYVLVFNTDDPLDELVGLQFFEPREQDEVMDKSTSEKILRKDKSIEAVFPEHLEHVVPEEMLRRLSMWVP